MELIREPFLLKRKKINNLKSLCVCYSHLSGGRKDNCINLMSLEGKTAQKGYVAQDDSLILLRALFLSVFVLLLFWEGFPRWHEW